MKTLELLSKVGCSVYKLGKKSVENMIDDENYRTAAEASFYLIFSVFPLLFLLFVLLGFLDLPLSNSNWIAEREFFTAYVPDLTFNVLSEKLQVMVEQYQETDIVFALLLFIWPASTVFHAYIKAVGDAYRIQSTRSYFQSRMLATFLLFGAGLVIFLTSFLFSVVPLIIRWVSHYSPVAIPIPVVQIVRYTGSFLLITPCLALIYRFGPDAEKQDELTIWPGAIIATLLWIFFSQFFSFYLKYLDTYRVLYGSLGGAMLLLIWMYLGSLAIIFGAEFNYTWKNPKGGSGNTSNA